MTGKKLWMVIGGVVLAVLLVAGALATRSHSGDSSTDESVETSASAEATGSSAEPVRASAEESTTQDPSTNGSPATPETAITPSSAPGEPVPLGSVLSTVTTAPAKTLALVSTDAGTAGDTFHVTFRPYGFGPTRPDGTTLVIRLDSATRTNTNMSSLRLASSTNALVLVRESELETVVRGGTYAGTLELVSSGGGLALRLSDVTVVAGQP